MKESTLKKILDLYKDGKISADEAEKMIGSKAGRARRTGAAGRTTASCGSPHLSGEGLLEGGDALCQSA